MELKEKLAFAEADGFEGLESIVVSGAARSIVNDRLEGDSALPALSVAFTRIV